MLIERKKEILKTLDENLVIVRDEDWQVLCLLWRDNEWYYVYYMEHYNITKQETEALLDKASWVAIIPVVDEKILEQYKAELESQSEIVSNQLERLE
jgi:hypothetical protein